MTDFNHLITRKKTNSIKWDQSTAIYGTDVLPMWVADMDFAPPIGVTKALQSVVDHNIYGYSFVPESTNKAIQAWLLSHYQWKIDSTSIIYNHNVVSGISVAIEALTNPGENVLITPPVYHPFSEVPLLLNRNVVTSPLNYNNNRYEIDFTDLSLKLADPKTTVFLLCSPHNPAGRIWSQTELEHVIALCDDHQVALISDEIHADLAFKKHTPTASLDLKTVKTVTLMAPSKTFNLAGLNAAFMICEDPLLQQRLEQIRKQRSYPSINRFGAAAMAAAYQTGGDWLEELRTHLTEMITLSHNLLQTLSYIETTPLDASYLLWIDYRKTGIVENAVMAELAKQGVGVTPGSQFGIEGDGFIRVNIATSSVLVTEGITKIVAAFKELGVKEKSISPPL